MIPSISLCNFLWCRYYDTAVATFQSAPPNPVNDFEAQMYVDYNYLMSSVCMYVCMYAGDCRSKVAVGLLSGDYSQSPPTPPATPPATPTNIAGEQEKPAAAKVAERFKLGCD